MRLFVLLTVAALALGQRKDYTGHRLVSVRPTTRAQLEILHSLETDRSYEELDFWTGLSVYKPVDIRVSPADFGKFRSFLQDNELNFTVLQENLQGVVDAEREQMERTPKTARNLCDLTSTYCTLDQIQAIIFDMEAAFPSNVKVSVIGNTYEGRQIHVVKVAEDLGQPKPPVWVEVGTHAREWMAIASGINLISLLLDGSSTSADMLAKYDWNIVPVHNPDGYVYSHTSSRYHRKNRQPGTRPCHSNMGIDLNRNWDIAFGQAGTSNLCSDDVYPGTRAFEAYETAALRDAIQAEAMPVQAFFSIHAYSELLLVPYAYTSTKPSNYDHLLSVAEEMAAWLETVRMTYYVTGTPPDILYAASGGAYDYFFVNGVPYSYTYELSPGPGYGLSGFNPSPSLIPSVSQEVYASLWGFVNLNL